MASHPINKDDPAYVGNELFKQGEFEKAVDAYSTAIEKFPNMAKLFSNRALAYLKLNRPYDAWKDTEKGLKIEPSDEKLIYRNCTALLGMRRFHEADQFLDDALKRMGQIPEKYVRDFERLIDDMTRLKKEFIDGRYDLRAMVEESKCSPILAKHADYYAWNKFEIREIDGKGRGLVAKEKIELGELLIACEAVLFVDRVQRGQCLHVMMHEVRNKFLNRPDLTEQFYRLYAGPQLGHLENWTECEPMDLERIEGVLEYNNFGDLQVLSQGTLGADPEHVGITLIPSYINHTCVDFNCARYFVGDYTFIRATRPIENGEELVFPCVIPLLPFDERQRYFEKHGFECRCRLCEIERQDSVGVKNRLKEIRQFLDGFNERAPRLADFQRLERIVVELRGYRPELSLDYLVNRVRKLMSAYVRVCSSDPHAFFPMAKELIEDLKMAGDFLEALYLTNGLKGVAVHMDNQREQDECDKLARGIAKLFFDDESVADLYV